MRALWRGSISFGLVNIPINVYSAAADTGIDFTMLHKKDLSPVRYAKICKEDGKEITQQDIVKGTEIDDGEYVVVTDEDFKAAHPEKSNAIEIIGFTDVDEVDPVYYEKPYYLEPEKNAGKAYVLLRDALKESNKVAIATFVQHQREHLAVIQPVKDLLILNQMRFYAELRQPDDLAIPSKTTKVQPAEMKMALALIEQLTSDFNPKDYHDSYIEKLQQIIKAKSEGKQPKPVSEKAVEPSNVKDLMSLLKASLAGEDKPKKADNVVGHRRGATRKVSKKA